MSVYDIDGNVISQGSGSSFDGKTVLCIGDSITENNSHNNNKSWCMYLNDLLGMTVVNQGVSGTGLVKKLDSGYGYVYRVEHLSIYDTVEPDLVLIMGDANDGTGGDYRDYSGSAISMSALPVGTTSDGITDVTVHGAAKRILKDLSEKYPTAKIGWITSTPRKQTVAYWTGKEETYGHGWFEDYIEAIRYECEQYSVPVLDLYHNTVLRPWETDNARAFYADATVSNGTVTWAVHPNTAGVVAGMVGPIVPWIVNNFG